MTAFRIAHLSDPHLPPPPLPLRLGDLASKRSLSRFAWRRKQRRHVKAVLDALCADVRARAPDHVAITGDLINFATPEEFAAARAWLETFGDPAGVTVSPGNHDALASGGAPKDFAPWSPWLGDGEAFPRVRRRGPVAIVNLSSAVPTPVHLAQGTLGQAQIDRAAHHLREAADAGLYRLVLVHHPLVRGVVSGRKAMTDAGALAAMLADVGADLVLHGHAHESHLTSLRGPAGPIPILCVPSASTPAGLPHDQPARWNEIAIEADGGAYRTGVTAHEAQADGTFAPAGRYVLV